MLQPLFFLGGLGSDVQSRLILSWKLFLEKVVEERLVEKIGKSPERVELEQGKETDEFLSLFNRRLIVMNGSYKNNIENGVVKRTPLLLSVRLWGNPAAIRTVEVEPVRLCFFFHLSFLFLFFRVHIHFSLLLIPSALSPISFQNRSAALFIRFSFSLSLLNILVC